MRYPRIFRPTNSMYYDVDFIEIKESGGIAWWHCNERRQAKTPELFTSIQWMERDFDVNKYGILEDLKEDFGHYFKSVLNRWKAKDAIPESI
jgi:hypothetical protein